jgi:transposase-like protein
MTTVRQKGKIPATEWPAIAARKEAGEPIAHIARDYGCTAPAIRYIVNRIGSGELPSLAHGKGDKLNASEQPVPSGSSSMARIATTPAHNTRRSPSGEARLSPATCERVVGEIAAFLVALDRAVAESSPKALAELRTSSEQLMRAAARVRIELERLDPMNISTMRDAPGA